MLKPSDFKRVQLESGAKITVLHVEDGMKVVDEPAVDRNGRPLDATYPEQHGEPTTKPYLDWKKDELELEILTRNEGRPDSEQIEVEAPGNKPELAAALNADDARA